MPRILTTGLSFILIIVYTVLLQASCNKPSKQYQGMVVNEVGKQLSGVAVLDDRGTQRAVTNEMGYFRFEEPTWLPDELVFQKEGYATDTIPVVWHQAGETTIYHFLEGDTTKVVLKQLVSFNERNAAQSINHPNKSGNRVGTKVCGDFDGDGQDDCATQTLVRKGEGNPVEDGTADEYAILFEHNKLPMIPAQCCDFRLVNEGDLNDDGADELSVFQSPMNGCTYTMYTFTFKDGKWVPFIAPFLISTGCEPLSDQQLQERIFKESGKLYRYKTDPNDEHLTLKKEEIK